MKKITLLLLGVFVASFSFIFAQAPQGLNYQAVAYNAGGTPVLNQAISMRLSILDGSATGNTVYQENQNPTTDNTGLFSIVIGNGVVVSGTFASINWGNGSKWLKTEIDITGGTNYLVMGTSQFMSVPYALYANEASNAGLGAASFTMPDGFDSITPVTILANTNYTVPAGKNLYFPSTLYGISIDGDTLVTSGESALSDSRTVVGASAGSVVSCGITKPCFLVNKKVDWVTFNFRNTPYVVPSGKQLIIINQSFYYYDYTNPANANCRPTLNGISLGLNATYGSNPNIINSVLDEGAVLSTVGCPSNVGYRYVINGYLKDK